MSRRLVPLTDDRYDVVVLGGGLAGAAAACALAQRGVSVALLDRADFGAATTASSCPIVHAGTADPARRPRPALREALGERRRLQRLAPHLVRPVTVVSPVYGGAAGGWLRLRARRRLDDWLASAPPDARARVLRAVDALSVEPALRPDDLSAAVCRADAVVVAPERLCLEHVLSACRHGARVFNYCEGEEVTRDRHGVVSGVRARDLLTGRVAWLTARIVVNATGPRVDDIRGAAGVRPGGPLLRRTKRVHCALPRLTERAVCHATSDTTVAVVPWRGFSLVSGTGGEAAGAPARAHATSDDVDRLLGAARRVVADARLDRDHVVYAYAGVCAQPLDEHRTPGVVGEEGGRLLSLTGATLASFRRLADALGDAVLGTLGRRTPGPTVERILDGGEEDAGVETPAWLDVSADVAATGLAPETLETLVATYGRSYRRVVELAGKVGGGTERLCPENPEIVAQLHYAVQEEHTISLQDVLLRRTGIGTSACRGLDCAEAIATRLAPMLGWSARRQAAELDAWAEHVARGERFRGRP